MITVLRDRALCELRYFGGMHEISWPLPFPELNLRGHGWSHTDDNEGIFSELSKFEWQGCHLWPGPQSDGRQKRSLFRAGRNAFSLDPDDRLS